MSITQSGDTFQKGTASQKQRMSERCETRDSLLLALKKQRTTSN